MYILIVDAHHKGIVEYQHQTHDNTIDNRYKKGRKKLHIFEQGKSQLHRIHEWIAAGHDINDAAVYSKQGSILEKGIHERGIGKSN